MNNIPKKLRDMGDIERFRMALVPTDHAMWESEQRWGVGRLERLVSPATLQSYQRGWSAYRAALDSGDATAVETIGPKMCLALRLMGEEAEAAGHKPLAPDTWETPLGDDGTVLVICRTQAEQSAVIRASRANRFTAAPGEGLRAEDTSTETNLPPDLAVTVRDQHLGRAIEVWTVGEVAALILAHGSAARDSRKWQGSPAHSGAQGSEGDAADIVRSGYPLDEALTEPARVPVLLDF
jgi:hypothetical protein